MADVVIENDGSPEEFARHLADYWESRVVGSGAVGR